MKFNDAYSQMFPGYPDAVSLQQAAEMLPLVPVVPDPDFQPQTVEPCYDQLKLEGYL